MAHKFLYEVPALQPVTPREFKKPPPLTATAPKWSKDKVLAEARKRTRELKDESARETQGMLEQLCKEAGWTSEDFLGALINDVAQKGKRH